MRLQLALVGLLISQVAYADGALTMRGVYYKERSTRVMQPMLDGMFDVGARGLLTAHLLVDAITSASATSGPTPAEPFSERRYEAGASYAHELDGRGIIDLWRLAAEGKFSTEPDYRSVYVGGRVDTELARKNATLSVGGGVALDEINNKGAQGAMGGPMLLCENNDPTSLATECPLNTYLLFTSASQLLSPKALVGISYDQSWQSGFTSNAYRSAVTATGFVPERHPNERTRHAIGGSARYYVPQTKTAFIGAYRYYWDNWDIHAHTPEVRIIQEVGRTAEASVRYRYYRQDAAFFWAKSYPDPATLEFVTDDPKMSPFDGQLFEAKLDVLGDTFGLKGIWAPARFEGILEYIVQDNRFGNAVVAHVAITFPFEY